MSRANHSKAPQCAAFVKALREEFGEVKVLYVNENGFTLGEKSPDGAPCYHFPSLEVTTRKGGRRHEG